LLEPNTGCKTNVMAYAYSELLDQSQQWLQRLVDSAYLESAAIQAVLQLNDRGPEQWLSRDGEGRPLIVAFMGGTGVGKSSLLNRLAGEAIAKAGIERPTSREVTVYLHDSLSIQRLPGGLPLASVKLGQHANERYRSIVWIDMPDFDSVELGNQRQVLKWLPHIDALLYVVSPERYRDNKAWQLLLAEGAKHAWLFVMNQWDRGLAVQFDDLKQQLAKAGFQQPLLFRTSCTEPVGDDFEDLVRQIERLSGQTQMAELERRHHCQRLRELQQGLEVLMATFERRDHAQLLRCQQALWPVFEQDVLQGLGWSLQQRAKACVNPVLGQADIVLWDAWAQNRFSDLLDELIQQADRLELPLKPLRSALQPLRSRMAADVLQYSELHARQALLQPGNGLQRFLLRLAALSEVLLPLMAMAVVGYQVFAGYYHGAEGTAAYLGTDFAIHSVLLIALCWLIPFFLHQKLQPSLDVAARKGLEKGLRIALASIDAELRNSLKTEQQTHQNQLQHLKALIDKCSSSSADQVTHSALLNSVLPAG